jgi:Cytochrome C oxidase, cbb3-type, subunit III
MFLNDRCGLLILALAIGGLTTQTACIIQPMANQPSYRPLELSNFFPDHQSERHPVRDTVPRDKTEDDSALFTGKVNGQLVTQFPFPITREVMDRGQQRFNIYCSPCHDEVGTGNGMVVRRGFTRPPTYHKDELRNAPVGHFFDVITNGYGAMPSYAVADPAERSLGHHRLHPSPPA